MCMIYILSKSSLRQSGLRGLCQVLPFIGFNPLSGYSTSVEGGRYIKRPWNT